MGKQNPYDKIVDDLEKSGISYYSSFGARLMALIIDSVILILTLKLVGFAKFPDQGIGVTFGLGGTLVVWLYYAVLESSKLQASIGKKLLGQKVVNAEMERISFLQATARTWAKALTIITLMLGFLMILFTSHNQALHDMLSGTYVKTYENT